MLKEGYPYVTENGNFILDTLFDFFHQTSLGKKSSSKTLQA